MLMYKKFDILLSINDWPILTANIILDHSFLSTKPYVIYYCKVLRKIILKFISFISPNDSHLLHIKKSPFDVDFGFYIFYQSKF